MAFKESEAGTKWCPMVRHEGDTGGSFNRAAATSNPTNAPRDGHKDICRCNCLGSACAAWAYTRGPVLETRFALGYKAVAEALGDDVSAIDSLRRGDDAQAFHLAKITYLNEAIKNPLLQNVADGWNFDSIFIDDEGYQIIRVAVRDKDPDARGHCGLIRE